MKKSVIFIFTFLFLALVSLAGLLFWRKSLQTTTKGTPFFVEERLRVTDLSWKIGEFQPYYLYSFKKDNSQFFKTLYLDDNGLPKLIDVFVGGSLSGNTVGLSPYKQKDAALVSGKKLGEYNYPTKAGQRIRILYLASADDPGNFIAKEICSKNADFCLLADYIRSSGNKYELFMTEHRLPKGDFLLSIQISNELINKK